MGTIIKQGSRSVKALVIIAHILAAIGLTAAATQGIVYLIVWALWLLLIVILLK